MCVARLFSLIFILSYGRLHAAAVEFLCGRRACPNVDDVQKRPGCFVRNDDSDTVQRNVNRFNFNEYIDRLDSQRDACCAGILEQISNRIEG